ncbi:hypothetical protein [Clostridium frigidicarnis]|uniref:Uncharacterized protein n=1 Tax=Clostridium frigidicarnis TaxID=84698 RepID=A0A1I1AKT8_9CLOT|nr:hypothetical protein [Clostridium frigidicarnis]SFB38624.1 hypothetical protein SAMN04488528_103923 [Clostridium frigidicarnis]
MRKKDLKKLKKVLKKIEENVDDEDEVTSAIKQRLKRIVKEVKSCVIYTKGYEYLPVQQFRILMEKIVNVVNLRDYGDEYLEYLNNLKEYEEIKEKRAYLSREKFDSTSLKDKDTFFKIRIKNMKTNINDIENYKYKKFKYKIGYLCNDSSRVIHDDNCTYNTRVDGVTLKEIEEIVLFFVSNIFYYFCKNNKRKKYLRNIHKASKRSLMTNRSIKKKKLKILKKELRGAA